MSEVIESKSLFMQIRWNVGFYILSVLIFWLGEKIAPSDMCNPGLGVFYGIFLFPLITMGLLIRSLILDFTKPSGKISPRTIVHLLAIAAVIIWLCVAP